MDCTKLCWLGAEPKEAANDALSLASSLTKRAAVSTGTGKGSKRRSRKQGQAASAKVKTNETKPISQEQAIKEVAVTEEGDLRHQRTTAQVGGEEEAAIDASFGTQGGWDPFTYRH